MNLRGWVLGMFGLIGTLLFSMPLPAHAAAWAVDAEGRVVPLVYAFDEHRQWKIICDADAMTDAVHCEISSNSTDVSVYGWVTLNSMSLTVGDADAYPGTTRLARVDGNPAFSVSERRTFNLLSTHASLLAQIRSGALLRVRWINWPYGTERNREVPTAGLAQAFDMAREYVRRCSTDETNCAAQLSAPAWLRDS